MQDFGCLANYWIFIQNGTLLPTGISFPKFNTYYNMKKVIRLTEGDIHRIVKESVKKVLKEGFGDGMIERELEKKLKILDSNGTIDKLFGGFYKCQPISFHAVYDSYDPDESGFVFNFKGGVVGKVTLGGIYGFPCDHLSGAETDAFEENINKLIPIIQNTIDNR